MWMAIAAIRRVVPEGLREHVADRGTPSNSIMQSDRVPDCRVSEGHESARATSVTHDGHYYDAELHRDHWFTNNSAKRARRWRELIRMLEPGPNDRILEIGCAVGEHALRLAPRVREVVGVDLASPAIVRARARAAREHISNAHFETCDAGDLSAWRDGVFDKVAAIDFFEHVDDRALAAILSEVRRVLIPGGRLAVYTPCATHYVERMKARNFMLRQFPGHIAVRTPESYAKLLAASGFKVTTLSFLPSDYPGFGLVDRLLISLPGFGRWFRHRICIVAIPV
jgi:2-polyprenyl-6-hydroxyphenyl methylase / 3-demethylubiquinone-9 3-methyltransferase